MASSNKVQQSLTTAQKISQKTEIKKKIQKPPVKVIGLPKPPPKTTAAVSIPKPLVTIGSNFGGAIADFQCKVWNEKCERDVKTRTEIFSSFRNKHLIDLENFEKSLEEFIEKHFSLADKKKILEFKLARPLPKSNVSSEDFKLTRFLHVYGMGEIILKLGEQEMVGVVDRNAILSSDAITYRKQAFELGGNDNRITFGAGRSALVMRLDSTKYILLDGQRRYCADAGTITAVEINPNTPGSLLKLAIEAINKRASIIGEHSYVRQIKVIQEIKIKNNAIGKRLIELIKNSSFCLNMKDSSIQKRIGIGNKICSTVLDCIEDILVVEGNNDAIPISFLIKLADRTSLMDERFQLFSVQKYLSDKPKYTEYTQFLDDCFKEYNLSEDNAEGATQEEVTQEENDQVEIIENEENEENLENFDTQGMEVTEEEYGSSHRQPAFYIGNAELELSIGKTETVRMVVEAEDNGNILQIFVSKEAVLGITKTALTHALRNLDKKTLTEVLDDFNRI